jgi:hypothetical protein
MAASRPSREETPETKRPAPVADPVDLPPWTPDLNIAKAIRVTDVTPTSANLEWPVELNGSAKFRIDRLILTRDSAKVLRNSWVEIPKTTFSRQGPIWTAHLAGLHPQQSQTVRIVPLDAEGVAGEALFRLDFYTLPQRALPRPSLLSTLIFVLFAIGAVTLWKRIRRQFTEPLSGF